MFTFVLAGTVAFLCWAKNYIEQEDKKAAAQ
jgi:hypothetical protein